MKPPLVPDEFPALPRVQGLSWAAFEAGLAYKNRSDLMLASMLQDTTVAGVFTNSMCPAAPVDNRLRERPSNYLQCGKR